MLVPYRASREAPGNPLQQVNDYDDTWVGKSCAYPGHMPGDSTRDRLMGLLRDAPPI